MVGSWSFCLITPRVFCSNIVRNILTIFRSIRNIERQKLLCNLFSRSQLRLVTNQRNPRANLRDRKIAQLHKRGAIHKFVLLKLYAILWFIWMKTSNQISNKGKLHSSYLMMTTESNSRRTRTRRSTSHIFIRPLRSLNLIYMRTSVCQPEHTQTSSFPASSTISICQWSRIHGQIRLKICWNYPSLSDSSFHKILW